MSGHKLSAAIDIGSSAVRMNIAHWDGERIATLERLEKPTQLGKEVFQTGYATFGTVNALSDILSDFVEKAREYGISSLHTLASTALREAANQSYILDHILTRNKLRVQVLEDTQVGSLMMSAIRHSGFPHTENTLLVNGGTGATDFELMKNDKIVLAQSIQTGLLKISEMLREASKFALHVEYMAEEYLDTFLTHENLIQDLWKADAIVFCTGDLLPFYDMFGIRRDRSMAKINIKKFNELYAAYRCLSIEQICGRLSIDVQRGGVLYAMLTLVSRLLGLTGAKKLFCIQTNISDAMQNLILIPGARRKYNADLQDGAISSAFDLAARYRCDIGHCEHIKSTALKIFDKLKELTGLTNQHRFLLRIACILHESGYYTNSAQVLDTSFDLVSDSYIYGLTYRETLLAAKIVSPGSVSGNEKGRWKGNELLEADLLSAAKMNAFLNLADALDYSHKQKAKVLDIALEGDKLIVSVYIDADYTLEQWMFQDSAKLFQEIFGITPVLRKNNIYDIKTAK
jgi:exopolyphosphatase/guanosine-5'-triphosphate,3'-diphosphate pyrophosphatase